MKIPKIPKITHQQAAILAALWRGTLSGKELRARLAALAIKMSSPNFYQMMARLERSEKVKGFYDVKPATGGAIRAMRERRYILQPKGAKDVRELFVFYDFVRSH